LSKRETMDLPKISLDKCLVADMGLSILTQAVQLERDAVGYMKMYAKYMEKIEESREGSKTVTIVVDPITVDRW